MGCLKIKYNLQGEALTKSWEIFVGGLEKNASLEKNCLDYYPFGMKMPGRQYVNLDYDYGYQGQYSREDDETKLNSFELRQWDARIARWTSTDPYGQYFSPC